MNEALKVDVIWTTKEPNTIKEPYKFAYELDNKHKVDMYHESDEETKAFFLNLWTMQVIKLQYPKTCLVYPPVLLKATVIPNN